MEKSGSTTGSGAVKFWVIWFPAFVHRERFEVTKNPIGGKADDRFVNDKAKGKSFFRRLMSKFIGRYYDSANIPIHIEFIDKGKRSIELKECIVNCDIILKYTRKSEDKKEKEVFLKYLQHSSEGLFLYECNADSEQTIKDAEKHVISYYLKEVCHSHLFHGEDSAKNDYHDYYFKIYSTTTKPDLNNDNNDAIKHYLEAFCEKCNRHIVYFEREMSKEKSEGDLLSPHIAERTEDANIALGLLGFIDKKGVEKDERTKVVTILDGKEYDKDKLLKAYDQLEKYEKQHTEDVKKFIYSQILAPVKKQQGITVTKKINNKRRYDESIYVVGETLYLNTLRSSKYLKPDLDKDIERQLLNLKNLTKTLYFIRDYYRYQHEKKRNNKTLGITTIVALLIFMTGMIYDIFSSKKTQRQSMEILQELKLNNSSVNHPSQNTEIDFENSVLEE